MHAISRSLSSYIALFGYILFALLLFALPQLGMAAGLDDATQDAEEVNNWLFVIVPVVCISLGACVGVAYSAGFIRKDELVTYAVGVVFAGAIAGGIVKLAFS